MKRRILALLLVLCLCAGLVPAAFAAETLENSVDLDQLVTYASQMYMTLEGHYDTVTKKDSNACSIGFMQWHGMNALRLLKMICAADPTYSRSVLGDTLYNEVLTKEVVYNSTTGWKTRVLNDSEAARIKTLINSTVGRQCQNELARIFILDEARNGWQKGIRTEAALIYYCSIENQYGVGGVKTFMNYVRSAMGISESTTINSLDQFHNGVKLAAKSYSYVNNHLAYRNNVYNFITQTLGLSAGPGVPTYPSSIFSDVAPDAWYREAVDFALTHNLFNGTSSTTFSPNTGMNRAMLVTVLYRMNGEPYVKGRAPFVDVKEDSYYSNAVLWAAIHEIVNGVNETQFCPTRVVTHEQAIVILYRYHTNYLGYEENPNLQKLSSYADGNKVSNYAREAMAWAVQAGIVITTTSGGKTWLTPKNDSTRAEIAVYLMRYLTLYPS